MIVLSILSLGVYMVTDFVHWPLLIVSVAFGILGTIEEMKGK